MYECDIDLYCNMFGLSANCHLMPGGMSCHLFMLTP